MNTATSLKRQIDYLADSFSNEALPAAVFDEYLMHSNESPEGTSNESNVVPSSKDFTSLTSNGGLIGRFSFNNNNTKYEL